MKKKTSEVKIVFLGVFKIFFKATLKPLWATVIRPWWNEHIVQPVTDKWNTLKTFLFGTKIPVICFTFTSNFRNNYCRNSQRI